MQTLILINKKTAFECQFTYNDEGYLVAVQLLSTFENTRALEAFWRFDFSRLSILERFAQVYKYELRKVIEEVSFELFYNTYGVKEGKKKAEISWNKLPKSEQIKAYKYIGTLRAKKSFTSENLPYPATYLNQARWND